MVLVKKVVLIVNFSFGGEKVKEFEMLVEEKLK